MVKAITTYSPASQDEEWTKMGSKLADPEYNKAGQINALLGLGIWIKIVESKILKSPTSNAMAQQIKLGYVIFKTGENPYESQHPYVGSITQQCEEIFKNYHYRNKTGRYIVRIPFNDKLNTLGKSKSIALRQFFAMETIMKRNPELDAIQEIHVGLSFTWSHGTHLRKGRKWILYTASCSVFSGEISHCI